MSTEIAQAPEAAPAEPEAVSEAPAQEIDLETLRNTEHDPDEIAKALWHGGDIEIPVVGEEPKQEAAPEPEAAKAPEEAPQTAKEPDAEEEADDPALPDLDKPLPNRISTQQFDPATKRAMKVMHALNQGKKWGEPGYIPLEKAMEIVKRESKQPEAKAPEADPVQEVQQVTTDLDTKLSDLEAQKRQLIADGEDLSEIEAEIRKTDREIARAQVSLEFAKRDQQAREQNERDNARKEQVSRFQTAQESVLHEFPSAKDRTSTLGTEIAAVIAEFSDPEHSNHALLQAGDAPRFVTNEAIARLAQREKISIAKATARFSAAPPAPPVPVEAAKVSPPPKKVLPASGGTTPPVSKTLVDLNQEVGFDSDKAFAALFGDKKSLRIS